LLNNISSLNAMMIKTDKVGSDAALGASLLPRPMLKRKDRAFHSQMNVLCSISGMRAKIKCFK
jgi:hypothetical protein